MSDFTPLADAPLGIHKEGANITITFDQGVPVDGQGLVSWNIPKPWAGCGSGQDGAYCGIVVVLSEAPVSAGEIPQDGTMYVADPTANRDLHVGDKIGNAMVMGAFYEGTEKAKGEELTTSFVVTDLKPNTVYYVAGYAVDCQLNYHSDGVRAYSGKLGSEGACPGEPARQPVQLGTEGVHLSDITGLLPGATYEFDLVVDHDYPHGTQFQTVNMSFDGINVPTYGDLLEEINRQILLFGNPPRSPSPPNTGTLYWNDEEQQLYEWDGYKYVKVDAIVEPTDPAAVAPGTYWYNPETKELKIYEGSPLAWADVTFICYANDPTNLTCSDHWFNGTTGYVWNGTTWCELPTVITSDCPTDPPTLPCGTFWYDEATMALFERDTVHHTWVDRAAVYWHEAPNALSAGTHWFDLDTELLYVRSAGSPVGSWAQEPFMYTTEPPIAADDGAYWYNPENEELRQYVLADDEWQIRPCLVWPGDPTDVTSCELWWQAGASPEALYTWDAVHNEWDEVKLFVQSEIDPAAAPIYPLDTVCYNPETGTLHKWDGEFWNEVDFINLPVDPSVPQDGWVWNDKTNDKWFVWTLNIGSPVGSPTEPGWVEFNPIDSANDPTMLPNGTYWFNTSNDVLSVRNGINWLPATYVTTPIYPTLHEKWYDITNDVLYCWDGYEWVVAKPIAECIHDSQRNFLFQTTETGSNTIIFIPIPEGAKSGKAVGSCVTTGYADFDNTGNPTSCSCTYSSNGEVKPYPVRVVPLIGFLWEFTTPDSAVLCPMEGGDAKIDGPSYSTIGVGDDGTPDERRLLIEDIRLQLGHPVVTVELTQAQFDKAIGKALDTFRMRSSSSLTRGFFFLDILPRQQRYCLTNQNHGYHKIVNIMAINRLTSAFASSAHGAGVYGQIVLQHLYSQGTFDLTTFYLQAQYIEQLEMLFATRMTFNWNEPQRLLDIYTSFWHKERVLMECAVERTEQDIITDRWSKPWIEQWALMECMLMLAQERGKFATLPGAGGGVSLNAADLYSQAMELRTQLLDDIDNFVSNKPEDFGMESSIILG